MKNGKQQTYSTIFVIISKLYNVQALTKNKEYAFGFADLIGGVETCIIVETLEDKLELDKDQITNNTLYEWNGIWLTNNLDCAIMEFLELKQSDMAGLMTQMMEILDYYKFTDEEQVFVNRFVDLYDYYFVRDIHGFTAYDVNEEVDYPLLIRMYLNTVKRNS